MNIQKQLAQALREATNIIHIEKHVRLGYGTDFERCPHVRCQRNAKLIKKALSSLPQGHWKTLKPGTKLRATDQFYAPLCGGWSECSVTLDRFPVVLENDFRHRRWVKG